MCHAVFVGKAFGHDRIFTHDHAVAIDLAVVPHGAELLERDLFAPTLMREHDKEQHADEQQECEGQHLERRVLVDELRDLARHGEHHAHADDDGGDHDPQILGHAHRGDD